ncbi:MAG: hypothetical protein ABSA80_06755 [Terriglobales bacterium]|jgi:hypothetical protein
MKASNTHFEQIPVETVKKIAEELPQAIEIDDGTTETQQDEVIPQQKRWHEIAWKLKVENDPQRMTVLVEELIAAFDEEQRRKSGKDPSVGACNSGPAVGSNPHDPPSILGQLGSEKASDLLE